MKEIFDERARFRQSSVYTTFVPDRPIRLTQCCTQLKPFEDKRFFFQEFPYDLHVNATV